MKKILLVFMSFIFLFASCTDLSEVENRLDKLEHEVSDIKGALEVLDKAYKDSKSIKSIDPLDESDGGWRITFSDNQTIEIKNGTDGQNGQNGEKGENSFSPYLILDMDGYWNISYDFGKTFIKFIDSKGNYVKGEGEDAKTIRLSINDKNEYVFELYNLSDSSKPIDIIVTPYFTDTSKIIDSIVQDDNTGILTLTLGNGTSYVFGKEYSSPSSISILTTKTLRMSEGSIATVEFRVNPSNARFNFDVSSKDCNIELDLLGSVKSSYVTAPKNFRLAKVEQVYNEQGVLKAGQYRAYIADLKVSNNYAEDVALVLSITNSNNEKIQVSSSAFNIKSVGNLITSFSFLKSKNSGIIYDINANTEENNINICSPSILDASSLVATFNSNGEKILVNDVEQISGVTVNDFTAPVKYTVISADGETNSYIIKVSNTGLPVVVVNTPDNSTIPPKTSDWLKKTEICIYDETGSIDYKGTKDNIRGRGNSTWTYPKKPYAIKLDSKAEILGMPKHKRWVLLANWMDRTMMRNSVAFKIAELSGMEWAPRGKFVELVLNGTHMGNYYLCEQIKIDENRVDINEMEDTDIDGDAITGGYLMELDVYFDEVNKFKSSVRNLPYMIKEPDEDVLNAAQLNYIQNYINTLETALYDDSRFASGEYKNYLDVESFIKWWVVHELTHNKEPLHPKSSYMFKDKLGKLKAGPVWDFDWGTFITSSNYSVKNAIYYARLFEDPQFVSTVKTVWTSIKPQLDQVADFIDDEGELLESSAQINISMWPISGVVNGDETMPFTEAVVRMKAAYTQRLAWLDNQISNF